MKTLDTFSKTVFFLDDSGWRVYYSPETFVDAVMGGYGHGFGTLMRPNEPTVEVTALMKKISNASQKKYKAFHDELGGIYTPETRKAEKKFLKELKAELVAEVHKFLAQN